MTQRSILVQSTLHKTLLNSVIEAQKDLKCLAVFHYDLQQDEGSDKCTQLILLNRCTKETVR